MTKLPAPGPGSLTISGTPAEIVGSGPIPEIHGVVRWRLIDLIPWLCEELGAALDETSVGRALQKLDHVKLTARPRDHAQNEYAMEVFKRGFAAERAKVKARWTSRVRPCGELLKSE